MWRIRVRMEYENSRHKRERNNFRTGWTNQYRFSHQVGPWFTMLARAVGCGSSFPFLSVFSLPVWLTLPWAQILQYNVEEKNVEAHRLENVGEEWTQQTAQLLPNHALLRGQHVFTTPRFWEISQGVESQHLLKVMLGAALWKKVMLVCDTALEKGSLIHCDTRFQGVRR